MAQSQMQIAFAEAVTRDRCSAGLNQIAMAVGLLSSNRPSKSKLVLWLTNNPTLVIAMIRAARINPDEARRALTEIAAQEAEETR